MRIRPLAIPGAAIVDAQPFSDHRGVFARWFCSDELAPLLGGRQIVNVNFSRTERAGAIRGMHFQYPPAAEMKWVRCIRGKVFDVMIDLRKDSPTFLQWYGEELTPGRMNMVVVPEGVAHGFQTLEDASEMVYLHTHGYVRELEAGVRYNDPCFGIEWPLPVTEVSERDAGHPLISGSFEGVSL